MRIVALLIGWTLVVRRISELDHESSLLPRIKKDRDASNLKELVPVLHLHLRKGQGRTHLGTVAFASRPIYKPLTLPTVDLRITTVSSATTVLAGIQSRQISASGIRTGGKSENRCSP